MKHLTSILIIMTFTLSLTAQRQRTTRNGRLTTKEQTCETTIRRDLNGISTADSLQNNLDRYLHLSGYDKPISAARETIHATNLTDTITITAIECEITYLDRQHRQLHKRTVTIHDNIKPLQTEMLSFSSWDLQRSFYYIRSTKPRRQATPYDVSFKILSITYQKQ